MRLAPALLLATSLIAVVLPGSASISAQQAPVAARPMYKRRRERRVSRQDSELKTW